LLVAFLAAALFTAYLTFSFFRSVATSRGLAPIGLADPEKAPPEAEPTLDPEALNVPLQDTSGPAPRPWDGASRVTILLMGLDYADWAGREGPAHTDTMMLFTLDPLSRTAGILSVPRDLWVDVPGYGYNKINTAYFIGQAEGLPGGGPGLAIQTVEQFLGVPINFYAQVDFHAFEQFIDEIGGIEVEVPEEISVDPIGPHNTVFLEPGLQTLDGPTALAYARNRDTAGSDFDRAQRQQQVILAIRDRILSLNMLKILIQKSPILYQQLASGVHTNLTLEEIISLAWTASQISEESIKRGAIGPDQVIQDFSPEGLSILRPIPEEVRLVRDEVFTATGPASPAVAETGDPFELMKTEAARVSVLNGTGTAGLAATTSDYLVSQGIQVTETGNAQELYELTTIIDYSGKLYTVQYLVERMGIQPSQIYSRYDPNSLVDIAILLGSDWAAENPMP
jgi:LCP family protein required for cell wall assembly